MKKGKYIDYSIILACLSKPPRKVTEQNNRELVVGNSSLWIPELRQNTGLEALFANFMGRASTVSAGMHTEAA